MNFSQSVKLAGIIVAVAILYFMVRGMFSEAETTAETVAEPERFTVIAQTIAPQEWRDVIAVRGRTEAERQVVVRAETAGAVAETPTALGAAVKTGDVLCRIGVDARRAQLAEARAALAQADLDFNAARRLNEEGFRAETGVAAARAARDQAAAQVERARLELQKTEIVAPFDGVFDNRAAETGDFLSVGDPCGTVIQPTPFLITGAVSERDIGKISKGDRGVATLATGETVEGVIRFVAAAADPATRTFNVELEVPNEDGRLRDGVTAEFRIFAEKRNAHRAPRSALVLNDAGEIGVRTLTQDNIVRFDKVNLIGEEENGVWIDGLDGVVRLITQGQSFVSAGQEVDVSPGEGADADAGAAADAAADAAATGDGS